MDTFSADDLAAQLAAMRAAHRRNAPTYAQRMNDLARLRAVLKAHLHQFADAMSDDFGRRPRHESLLTDGMTVLNAIDYLRANLRRWMKPKRGAAGWVFFPGRTEIRCQPLGVVGVISPWNYPVNLALVPLATAIAAGNHVMLKPSEHTPRTSQLLRDMLANVFPARTRVDRPRRSPMSPRSSPHCRSIICSSPARPPSAARSCAPRRTTSRR